jgi:hypothetical protein
MLKSKTHLGLYITCMTTAWVYLILRAIFVLVFIPLAGGVAAHIAKPMLLLLLLEVGCAVVSIWKPALAVIGGWLYLLLMSVLWWKLNIPSVAAYLHDRSFDLLFLLALHGVYFATRSTSSNMAG